jgi:hypothetical protein
LIGSVLADDRAPGSLHQSAASLSKHAILLRSDRLGSSLPPKGSLKSITSRRVNQLVHAA